MAQVSKFPVHKDVEKRMFEIFQVSISSLTNPQDIEDFFHEFLSPVEKIMLSKRLSIAILLAKGYSYGTIASILRVTPPTIATVSINLKYSGKGYKKVVEKILRDEKTNEFWQKIEDILAHIPASKGSSVVRQLQERRKKRLKERKAF